MIRLAAVALVALTLTACAGTEASTRWTKVGASKAQAYDDVVACRRQANDLMSRRGDFRYYDGDARGAGSDPMFAADRQRLKDRLDALVAACMTEKGYYLPKR